MTAFVYPALSFPRNLIPLSIAMGVPPAARPTARPPVFVGAKTFRQNKNDLREDHFFTLIPEKACIALGLNVDSEFQTQATDPLFDSSQKAKARQFVTVQASDLLNRYPSILFHPDGVQYAKENGLEKHIRHPIAISECIAVDYLRAQGYHAEMVCDDRALTSPRTLCVTLCGFFLNVDLYACFQGDCLAFIEEAILSKRIVHQRHLQFVPEEDKKRQKFLRLPYFLDVDGQRFALAINFLDLVAAQGKTSLKDFSQNVGLSMTSKDLVGENITRMMPWYFENPQDYDAYALGDLALYPVWRKFCRLIRTQSENMMGADFAIEPSLTIGSTTNKILDGKRLQHLGWRSEERKCLHYAGIVGKDVFKALDDENNLAHTQLKVDGGRCHNNCPTKALLAGALCDLDISGAYSSAMMVMPAFFGNPQVVCLSHKRLKSVLKKYRSRLLPHHWTMRISMMEPLSFSQDLIPSYFDYKWKERKSDTESFHETGELDYESGTAKIFSREIENGMLTSDLLDVILYTWSASAREEFLSKVGVLSLLIYDPSCEVRDTQEFTTRFYQEWHKSQIPGTQKGLSSLWHKISLGEMGIEDFRKERSKHAKGTPQNFFYKLMGNTSYGVMVSHFFEAQNPVTANNITAFVRVVVYLSEKALGFYQTITDGGLFDLNGVLMARGKGKIFADKLFNYLSSPKKTLNRVHLKRSGLGGFHWRIEGKSKENLRLYKNDALIPPAEAKALINQLCLDHVKATFPTMPLFQNPHLSFEMKDFFTKAAFHGSSDYGFWQGEDLTSLKMRSYENKRHWGYDLDEEGKLVEIPAYQDMSPARWTLSQIALNPDSVALLPPFIKNEILKTGAFVHLYPKRAKSPIKPGDNLKKMGVPKWLSLNQFTFQTKIQMKNWEKASASLLRHYRLSFELFYLDDASNVKYQTMILELQNLIDAGVGGKGKEEMFQHFDPNRHRHRLFEKHPVAVRLRGAQRVMLQRRSDFYATTPERYESTIKMMADDFRNDCDGINEERLK
jgi:hypothetical protein